MSLGERAALEGLLCSLKPRLAIEIGTAEGGSLRRIAAHSAEVHSFDPVSPDPELAEIEHVTHHRGDSHELLPTFLQALEASGRNVDFALVDGDHSAAGVRRDIEDLLRSAAVARTVILAHDSSNEEVRRGIDAVAVGEFPKLIHVDCDLLGGYVLADGRFAGEVWGGFALFLVDESHSLDAEQIGWHELTLDTARLLREGRDRHLGSRRARLRGIAKRLRRRVR
jgi:hypothetical protein